MSPKSKSTAPVLEVRGLEVSYGRDAGALRAVDGVDLELRPGETLGLVGESGCGKTSAALALLGLLPFRAERLALDGDDLAAADEARWRAVRGKRISMVFQDPAAALDPVLDMRTQLGRVLRRHLGLDRKAARARAEELLERVDLVPAEILPAYPHQLSGGQAQRVLIAMAMAAKPAVLVADEATTALDVTTQAQVLAALGRLQRELGTAVLLVTHDLGVVAQTCDRVAVMYAGRVVEQAPAAELFARPRHPYTAGLLRAVPRVARERPPPAVAIPGQPPAPGAFPDGCRFAPRCPRADALCRERDPVLEPAGGDHAAACHHPL